MLCKERQQMTKEKSSTRGGKRPGAGRPSGTTKKNTKKMCSFRLSDEEKAAVIALLKKMRNK